jgi:hypothetical protein
MRVASSACAAASRPHLAVDPKKHGELLLAMNDKMNALIDTEVDEPDNGSFLPGKDAKWAATTFDP